MDVTRSETVPAWRRLLSDGSPVTGATIVLDIRRAGDGLVVDWADSTLKALGSVGTRYLSVPQVSATDHPGLYQVLVDLGTVVGVASSGDVLVVTYYEVTAGPTYTPIDDERWRVAAGEPLPTPEVIEVGQSETVPIFFDYMRNGTPVTGATVTLTVDRMSGGVLQRLDWDAEQFVSTVAATTPTVPMVEIDATYAQGVYYWPWDPTFPNNATYPIVYFITIKDGATVLARREIRVRTVDTINTIAAFGAPPTAAAVSAQVNADITTAHGAGSYQTASTAGLATGTNVSDAQAAILAKLPAALVSGRIDASVGAMAANTLTASALAADAVTEMQSGLATAAALATAQGNITTILGYGAPPTAAANAAAVWATTEGSGTMGASLALLRRRTTNKRHMNGTGVISFYADDGSTVEKTVTITDKDGVGITVASGDPARSSAEA